MGNATSVHRGVVHSANSRSAAPAPADTTDTTSPGRKRKMRGRSRPAAGCADTTLVVATTSRGRGRLARKHTGVTGSGGVLSRATARAKEDTAAPALAALAWSGSASSAAAPGAPPEYATTVAESSRHRTRTAPAQRQPRRPA